MIVAGESGESDDTSKLYYPHGLHIDHDKQSIVIADCENHCIVEWKMGEKDGKVIAGSRERGSQLDPLNCPTDILINKETDSLLIADQRNRRVIRWSQYQGTRQDEVIVDNIDCGGLVMDRQGYLYVPDWDKDEVRQSTTVQKNSIVVGASENGQGNQLNQLN